MKRVTIFIIGLMSTVLALGVQIQADDNLIHGCVNNKSLSVRIVSGPDQCNERFENYVSWNKEGPQGIPGPQGEQGPQGDKGDTGEQGPEGPAGDSVVAGQVCPEGSYVTGYTAEGTIICSEGIMYYGCGTYLPAEVCPKWDDGSGPDCDKVPAGSFCEGSNLVCPGLDDGLDNCGTEDWFFKVSEEQPLTVFVSSVLYDGNLGGVAGADAKCQQLASNAGLSGTYKAWISTSNGYSPSTSATWTKSKGPYQATTGMIIADNWIDLTDGDLHWRSIVDDEWQSPHGGYAVWTGTRSDGTPDPQNRFCQDWTTNSEAETGLWGTTGLMDQGWTEGGESVCSLWFYIYCFQQ